MQAFSVAEFTRAIGGDADINIADLRKHVHFHSGSSETHPTISALWQRLS